MKAAIHTKYGPPQVVRLADVPKPVVQKNEVLVKVYASTVNRTDSGFRSAEYVISRFWSGLFKPNNAILGCEYAGEIEETGTDVTLFKKGDRVFGYNDISFGGHAEYLAVKETDAIARIPENITYQEAAPITEGAHYALCNIRASKIQKGQHVLVYGATGAIGSAAVQILKHIGAYVVAVCGTKNIELVKSLGADEVIDYQTQDFTKMQVKFDFVFDAVGKSSFGVCKPLMNTNAIYVSTELGKNGENILLALITPLLGGKKVIFPIPSIHQNDINYLKELVEKGAYRPVIDRIYALEDIVEAYTYVETAQKIGNVVLNIRN